MSDEITTGKIRSSIESKDDGWIIRIRDDNNPDINIECFSVQEYAQKIGEVGESYDKIDVVWSKDMYLKPEHFEQVQEQMSQYKEMEQEE